MINPHGDVTLVKAPTFVLPLVSWLNQKQSKKGGNPLSPVIFNSN